MKEFPNLFSYNRFVERQWESFYPFKVLFECISGECDGLSYIDATCLPVCHIKRENFCKIFKEIAKKSKSTCATRRKLCVRKEEITQT